MQDRSDMFLLIISGSAARSGVIQVRNLGRVLLGLFRYRNTRNRRYLCSFGSYSGIGILGIDGICVLLGAIPFTE